MTRNIGIIGDGATDLEIFSKTVECILLNNTSRLLDFKCTKLTQRSLHNSVEHYLRHTTRENEYSLVSRYAQELQKDVADLLLGALTDFEKILGIGLCNHDILLLTTDAERSFSKPEDYFQNWRLSLSKNLEVGIEKFYTTMAMRGYTPSYLPFVISLVSFPSTEVFVAAAKNIKHFGKKPLELKQLLYGMTNLYHLDENELKEKALDFITPDSIDNIFQSIPESRLLIQTLSLI